MFGVLLACIACAVVAMTAVPVHAYAAAPVCTVDGVEYEDLGAAIDEAPDGAEVVLLADASLGGVKRLSKSLSINLGGHALACGTIQQTDVAHKLLIANGSVSGLISVKNLTLDGVTVTGQTQNGGVVSASNSSFISNSTVTNAYGVVDGRTSAALSVGGKGEHRITGSTFSGKSAVYVNNPTGLVRFDACMMTGLVSGSPAINLFSTNEMDVAITNSKVTAHQTGNAFSASWNAAGVIEFGEGNTVSGPVVVSGRDTSSNVYELRVSGGTFSAGGQMPFVPQSPEFEAQMLERLNVVGGTFDVDVSSVLRSGYECIRNQDGTWGVYDDVAASGYYTLATDGSKVKHSSIAEAISNGEGTVYVSRNVALSADEARALSAAARKLASAPGVTVSFDDTAAELLAALSDCQDLNVALKSASGDVTLRGLGISGGKMVACAVGITESNESEFAPLLAKGFVFDVSSSGYRVIATPDQGALIESRWYDDLDAAVTAASVKDGESPVSETITMLSDATGPVDVVYPRASFVIDFAGHTLDGGSGNGLVIAPVSYGGSLSSSPDGCNITLKNGKISAGNMGIGTNGTLKDVTLSLVDMEVISNTHGMYLAANGKTIIGGSTVKGDSVGVELRAGSLLVRGDSKISGGKGAPQISSNSSGTTSSNIALSVVQHTTKHPISVIVEEGTFEGGAALMQADPHGNNAGNVTLEVKDGTYLGSIESEDCTGFITGGSFSDEGVSKYLAEGSELVKGEDGLFGVQGEKPEIPPVTDPDGEGDGQDDKPVEPPATDPDEDGQGGAGSGADDNDGGQSDEVDKPDLPATGDNAAVAVSACVLLAVVLFFCGGLARMQARRK